MINFVTGSAQNSYAHMARRGYGDHAGMISGPRQGNDVRHAIELGMPWCLDNDCFQSYDPDAILQMLRRFQGLSGCVFATLPDVVCDHAATRLLFSAWIGTYQRYGYPPAFVLQNGVTSDEVPWDSIRAVFIGGDDPFKFSDVVRVIVAEAKRRDHWVHMGRVNTLRRIRYAHSIGCDSTDGTGFAKWPDKHYCFAAEFKHRQLSLLEEAL